METGQNKVYFNRLKDMGVSLAISMVIGAVISIILALNGAGNSEDNIFTFSIAAIMIGAMAFFFVENIRAKSRANRVESNDTWNMFCLFRGASAASASGMDTIAGMGFVGVIFIVIKLVAKVIYGVLIIPLSIVYIVVMTIVEKIAGGVNPTVIVVLDKVISIGAGIVSLCFAVYGLS